MQSVKVWDPVVRIFHWGTAVLFFANYLVLDAEGKAHRYAGYLVFGLVLVRLVWGVIGSKPARFTAFRPSLAEVSAHLKELATGERHLYLSHNPLGALMVYNLLACLVAISVTGIMMQMDAFWGVRWVENTHEAIANYAMTCVGLHVAGVLFETRRSKINLVRAMFTGRKEIPDHAL